MRAFLSRLVCLALGHSWRTSPVPPYNIRLCRRCRAGAVRSDGGEWRRFL